MMKLFRNIYYWLVASQQRKKQKTQQRQALKNSLAANLKSAKEFFGNSDDIVVRQVKLGLCEQDAFLLYIDGMADKKFIADSIMKPLMKLNNVTEDYPETDSLFTLCKEYVLTAGDVEEAADWDKVLKGVVAGDTALFFSGYKKALLISSQGFPNRGVQEPETESVVRGPREGFSEPLRINTTLIRRKIKNPDLRFESLTVGNQTKTNVCLVYMKDIVNEKVVTELRKRLNRIDTDVIFGAGYIEQFIEDAPFSPFATVGNTERPDVAAGQIMEGRVAIIIDGTPIVLFVPHLFLESFQSPEDYETRPYYVSLIRWLRIGAFFVTIYLPALYVALVTYHQELLPTPLLLSIAAAREGVPFPAFVESVGMGITFEFLREAGVRMPKPVGQAVSIVGALVIGESAVTAGLIGAPMVIITALTAITSFIVPSQVDVTIILRFVLTIAAGASGIYGIIMVTVVIIIHMVSLRSFGVPFLSPLAPLSVPDLKDVIMRAPLWSLGTRPRLIGFHNWRRQGGRNKPGPSKGSNKG